MSLLPSSASLLDLTPDFHPHVCNPLAHLGNALSQVILLYNSARMLPPPPTHR